MVEPPSTPKSEIRSVPLECFISAIFFLFLEKKNEIRMKEKNESEERSYIKKKRVCGHKKRLGHQVLVTKHGLHYLMNLTVVPDLTTSHTRQSNTYYEEIVS